MRISSAEFLKNYGSVTDAALVDPVTITRNGRDRLVLLSADEYERLKRRDRRVFLSEEMSDEDLALVESLQVGDEHAHLDSELEDWKP